MTSSFESGDLQTQHGHAGRYALGDTPQGRPRLSKKLAFSVPDLRFEQSYLHSLRRFIHHHDADGCFVTNGDSKPVSSSKRGEKSTKKSTGIARKVSGTETGLYGIPLRLDWGEIIYVTIRNQVRVGVYDNYPHRLVELLCSRSCPSLHKVLPCK